MKKGLFLFLTLVAVLGCLTGCMSSSTSSGYGGDEYSDSYYKDSNYRKTVDDISDMTGDSHKEVDRKIDAMTRAVNGE